MISNDLERLIEEIYTAALDRERWPQILTQIGNELAAASGFIGVQKVAGGMVWERTARLDPKYAALLKKQHATSNTQAVIRPRIAIGEPILTEVTLPQRLLHGVYLSLIQHPCCTAVLKFIRPANKGRYTPEELDLLRRLVPHLCRALEIDRRLETAKGKLESLETLLNSLNTATFLLDGATRLLYVNAAAKKLLSRKDGLRIRASHLVACRRDCDTALQGILTKATQFSVSPPDENAPTAIAIPRPSGCQPYVALAMPYPPSCPPPTWPGVEPAAMLFISDPETVPCPKGEILQMLYGLTCTEAYLTTLLASGKKLQESADTLHISLNTAKTHLKNIFSKTGTRRQSELIQLCLSALGGLITPPHSNKLKGREKL